MLIHDNRLRLCASRYQWRICLITVAHKFERVNVILIKVQLENKPHQVTHHVLICNEPLNQDLRIQHKKDTEFVTLKQLEEASPPSPVCWGTKGGQRRISEVPYVLHLNPHFPPPGPRLLKILLPSELWSERNPWGRLPNITCSP